ncbi:MAG TPA: DUF3500 domain-containing protein, partial [Chthonomonadales bacterium]|nr:DUF3500 domain-containing protein [Chthonomonadales bacterium]
MYREAIALLNALSESEIASALFPFESEERFTWHYVPRQRLGLPLKSLTSSRQQFVLNLVRAGLSERGFSKVEAIRALEPVLHDLEGGVGPTRDSDLYYISLFGKPRNAGFWSVRFEGHHISFHWLLQGETIVAASPQFLGANPAEVRISGPLHGARALAREEDLGRALALSLTSDQRAAAVVAADAPADIVSGVERTAIISDRCGVAYGDLLAEQKNLFRSLLDEYVEVGARQIAEDRRAAIREAGLESIVFGWLGGLQRGEGHYYRLQGMSFLIEYDNTQNDANHIHTVWRDFRN